MVSQPTSKPCRPLLRYGTRHDAELIRRRLRKIDLEAVHEAEQGAVAHRRLPPPRPPGRCAHETGVKAR